LVDPSVSDAVGTERFSLLHQLCEVLPHAKPAAVAGAILEFVTQEGLPNRALT
jgi:hypothetical protein